MHGFKARLDCLLLLVSVPALIAFDWNHSLDGHVTRCFQKNKVKVFCSKDSIPPSSGSELRIQGNDFNGDLYLYGYLKIIEGGLCEEHFSKIEKVLKQADQVCITGWGESKVDGEVIAHWDSLETKNGKVLR